MAYAPATSHAVSGFLAPIASAFATLRAAWHRSRVYARTYSELSALSSRELADIGVSRSMITRMAYEAAYGRDDS